MTRGPGYVNLGMSLVSATAANVSIPAACAIVA
jgi:hypothetical protein